MEESAAKKEKSSFEQLLQEYRTMGIHFLKVVTTKKEFLLILNDSYYMTYWDDSQEVVFSIVISPKEGVAKEPIEHYDMNQRNLDEWYKEVRRDFEARPDKDDYNPPHRKDIRISYMNEMERAPLKDFVAIIPRTEYRVFGDYIMFLEIGTGLKRAEKYYHANEPNVNPVIDLWLNRKALRRFNYELEHVEQALTIHANDIKEIRPAVYGTRFAFDDGDVKILRDIFVGT